MDHATCVLINPLTYKNRENVFRECLFQNVQISFYVRYVSIMNKKINVLKAYNYIHPYKNVAENLIRQLDIPISLRIHNVTESMPLNELRRIVMNEYFKEKLQMHEEDIKRVRATYTRLNHTSFLSIVDVLNVLSTELEFSNDRIIKNSYLMHARADNIRRILLEISKIGETDIKQIIYDRPKILMQPCDSIKKIIEYIKKFNISENSIEKCIDVLTLGPETVHQRLSELSKVKDFQVHFTHPRFLRLIHYQRKVKSRLEYLKSLKIRCYSIHLLSASSEQFEKFTYDGMDRTKGMDILEFLIHNFKADPTIVRSVLKLHPNWLQAPLVEIKQTYDFLRHKNFTDKEIYDNLIILLYPKSRLQAKILELMAWKNENDECKKINNTEVKKLSNTKLLNLCIYFIESEYHFTGDGIFEVQKLDKQQDPAIMIKDFPKSESQYRFGSKNLKKSFVN